MSESTTFNTVAKIISESTDLGLEEIKPDSDLMDDLGIDSLAFLDIAFEIDKTFGIQLPVESWMEEVNQGKADKAAYFVVGSLCGKIDELVAARAA